MRKELQLKKSLAALGHGKWKSALGYTLLLIGLLAFGVNDALAQTPIPDALKLDKKFIPDDETGHSGKLWLETYTTGEVQEISTVVPTDIILVLDVSSSMSTANTMTVDGVSTTRLRALQKSVAGFVDLMYNNAKDNECEHRLAVVTFCGNTKLVSLSTPTLSPSSSDYINCLVPINDNGSLNSLLGSTLTGGVSGTSINSSDWNSGSIYNARATQGGNGGGTGQSGTLMHNGLTYALNVLNARSSSGGGGTTFIVEGTTTELPRNMVVVFFTDGYPAQGRIEPPANWPTSGYNLPTNADAAVQAAQNIKTIQVQNPSGGEPARPVIYSIGVAEGVDNEAEYVVTYSNSTYSPGVNCLNGLLHYISNDYEYSDAYTDWQSHIEEGSIANGTFRNRGFYYAAEDADALEDAFKSISTGSGGTTVDLGANTTVQDVISASFKLPAGANKNSIKVYAPKLKKLHRADNNSPWQYDFTAQTITIDEEEIGVDTITGGTNYSGRLTLDTETGRITDDTYENRINSSDVIDIDEETKTISFTHFDFSYYYCGPVIEEGDTVGYVGRKLVMVIPIEIEEGVWGDGINTNGELSYVTPDGELHYLFPQPTADVLADVWTEVVQYQPETFDATQDPIEIGTPEDLAWFISYVNGRAGYEHNDLISSHPSANAILTADIDMSAHNWVPIGSGNLNTEGVMSETKLAYSGTFDGNGHVITGLKNNASKYYKKVDPETEKPTVVVFPGMFSTVTGTVKNVFVLDADFRGRHHNNGFVHHGIIADTLGVGGNIFNCEAVGSITCNDEPDHRTEDMKLVYGGLVGLNHGTIHSSMAMATLTAYSMGGLVGENRGIVANSFTNGVYNYLGTGDGVVWDPNEDPGGLFRYVGGLVGRNHGGEFVEGTFVEALGTIDNCYVRFQRNNDFGAQGNNAIMFGQFVGTNCVTNSTSQGTIKNCYYPWDNTRALVADNGTTTDCNYYSYPTAPSYMRYYRSNDNMVGGTWQSHQIEIGGETQTVYILHDGTTMVDKLNEKRGDYTEWKRTTAGGYGSSQNGGNINGDHPVLKIDGFTCLASTDGIALDYATSLDEMLERHNYGVMNASTNIPNDDNGVAGHDYSVSEAPALYGATINLYANDNTSKGTSTTAGTMVYIDETVSLLQSTTADIDAYTGQTMINYNGSDDIQSGRRWHNVSSSLQNSVFGWTYGATDQVPHNWDSDPCKLWLLTSNEDQAIFPTDMRSTNPFDFYCFFEPEYHWVNFKRKGDSHWHMDDYTQQIHYYYTLNGTEIEDNETQFIPGKGYLLAIHPQYFGGENPEYNMHYWTESESAKKDRQFLQNRGTLNNGTITIPVTTSAPEWTGLKGYNLLGNPYQSYLDFTTFAWANSDLWKDASEMTYAIYDPQTGDYVQGTAGEQPSPGALAATGDINMHQGFMIRATAAGTATFTNDMRSNTPADGTHFRGSKASYPLVNLILTDAEGKRDIAVLEVGRPENGGGQKLRTSSAKGHISLRHDNKDFGILFSEMTEGSQPLYFDTDEDGTFTLSWNTANANFSELTLVDNLTGVRYDMLANDSYTFQGNASDYRSRFKVVIGRFTDVEENEETVTDNFAFFDGSDWIVNGQGQLTVTDMTGRTVYTSNLINDQNRVSLNGVANGVYLMRVANGQNVNVQKIIIK